MSKVVKIVVGAILVVASFFFPQFAPILLSIGLSLISSGISELLVKKSGSDPESGKTNVKITEPLRWLNAGLRRQGGGVLFGEFDTRGDFWFVVVHSDSLLSGTVKRYFDDTEIQVDGAGNVITNDFCLTSKKDSYTGSGTKVPYFQIWTTTYTAENPTPPPVAALAAAFPGKWTSEHKLVGTTFSVIRCKALDLEHRYKIYRWRGPFGLGEPAFTIVGEWEKVYDPRDGTQTLGVPSTYKFSRNAELIWAWFRTHRYGRNKSLDSINWTRVGEQATICDQVVSGIESTQPRYTCDAAIPDDQERATAEQSILSAMDAQLVFDDDGKCWARAGYYQAATVSLSRNRDILAMESIEGQSVDNETQGVVVRYVEPAANYTMQPASAYRHPDLYVPGLASTFQTVDVPTCTNHNQAMRLAKALCLRSQPAHKIAPTVGLRGLRLRKERITQINYDNTFAGEYEIITPVEVASSGIACGFGAIPVDQNRWTLLAGEEISRTATSTGDDLAAPALPGGVVIAYNNARIEARFTPSLRDDVQYEFEYIVASEIETGRWLRMSTNMVEAFSYSGAVDQTIRYLVRYRSVTNSGRASEYSANFVIDPIGAPAGSLQAAVLGSWIVEVVAGAIVVGISSTGTLTIINHTRRYPDGASDAAVTGAVIETGLTVDQVRSIAYDDPERDGGAVTYTLYTNDNDAHASATNPGRHFVGWFRVPATGSAGGGGGGLSGGQNPGNPVTSDDPTAPTIPGMETVEP